MKLTVNSGSDQPIYEQIKLQIKQQITSGELKSGEMLPSIRMLAKELKIGIITAKRAYDDLTEEGFTVSVAGKGVFVAFADKVKLCEAGAEALKKQIANSVQYARANGISRETYERIFSTLWEDSE